VGAERQFQPCVTGDLEAVLRINGNTRKVVHALPAQSDEPTRTASGGTATIDGVRVTTYRNAYDTTLTVVATFLAGAARQAAIRPPARVAEGSRVAILARDTEAHVAETPWVEGVGRGCRAGRACYSVASLGWRRVG
jgi:hypothetical protein